MGLLRKSYVNVTANIDAIPISFEVKRLASESKFVFGALFIFVPSATSAVVLLEKDPKIYEEYKNYILEAVPERDEKRPDRRSGTGYTHTHVRAALVGHSLQIPIAESQLQLGLWQEVVFFDFEDKAGRKEVIFVASGELPATAKEGGK